MLHTELARSGLPVAATREPSDSALGKLARHGTDDYQGLVLACLVAADRYHHLEHDIRPAVHAGL
jgi:dTMP kinase